MHKDFTKHCEACTLVWRDEISLEVKSMRILFILKWFIALFQLQKINLPSGLWNYVNVHEKTMALLGVICIKASYVATYCSTRRRAERQIVPLMF